MELRPRKLRLQLWGMGSLPPSLIPFSTNVALSLVKGPGEAWQWMLLPFMKITLIYPRWVSSLITSCNEPSELCFPCEHTGLYLATNYDSV